MSGRRAASWAGADVYRRRLKAGAAWQAAMAVMRTKVATLAQDRYMAPSIEAAADMIATGTLCGAVDLSPFVQGFAE